MAKDYYGILGVSREADDAELKRAYRKLARELHPDVNPDAETQARFQDVKNAYEVLTDPQKRRIVDLGGDPLETRGGGGGGAGGFSAAGFGGLGDIMDAFFGAAGATGGRGPRSRVQPGEDALIRIDLTLEECSTGVARDLTVDTAVLCEKCHGGGAEPGTRTETCDTCDGRGEIQNVQRSFIGQVVTARACPVCRGTGEIIPSPCSQCGGDGRVRSRRTVTVQVPAGVGDGMRIRMANQGEVGPGGGPAGDLYIEVSEERHEYFTRDGVDLHCHVSLPMTAAALGTTLPQRTLEGEEELTIEAGTQPNTTLTLRGRGMPRLRSTGRTDGRGDLLVHLDVQVPDRLDTRQTELLRELAELRGEERPDLAHRNGLFGRRRSGGRTR
ncbi:molecular chaperone DnaJ [Actinomycetospora succinea]|uniref:Chaperone protein DnaJ n=1 Tax=Actinomycetospora succinea TaxID=663603 RepID=A0A4R6V5C4_9PSEU|nr:molecular chaperone DnaJ [Actinomycetospora succinea]TDQ53985.1 molecular chaperone DnaJ [Actinomycetospora succinea]